MKPKLIARWRANFLAGLVIVGPGIVSAAALVWLFNTAAAFTDFLLFFLPRWLTHENHGAGPVHPYWSVVAIVVAAFLIGAVGLLARNYLGKRLIDWVDAALLRVPLLNKIYGTVKQVNAAFSTGDKTSFRTVVLVQYPRPGIYSIGFITNEESGEAQARLPEKVVAVFIPATPNPTSGFLLLVPEDQVIKLEMSVPDGIKYVISLGAIVPPWSPPPGLKMPPPRQRPAIP